MNLFKRKPQTPRLKPFDQCTDEELARLYNAKRIPPRIPPTPIVTVDFQITELQKLITYTIDQIPKLESQIEGLSDFVMKHVKTAVSDGAHPRGARDTELIERIVNARVKECLIETGIIKKPEGTVPGSVVS